jgi:CheY-like chemotaxis protein
VERTAASNVIAERNAAWLRQHNARATGHAILIVEDSEADIFFLLRAFARSKVQNPVVVVRTGAEAIEYLRTESFSEEEGHNEYPRVIFLDLKVPAPDGLALLRWKSREKRLPKALWIALSNFDTVRAINEAYAAGASTFLAKPLDSDDIRNLIRGFEDFWQVQRARRAAAHAAAER